MRVHLLCCETRAQSNASLLMGTLRLTSRMPTEQFVVANICLGHEWGRYGSRMLGKEVMVKVAAVHQYAMGVPADDLLLVLDSDVAFNGWVTSQMVTAAYHTARGDNEVVFQAEPWCFAPNAKASMSGFINVGGCTRPFLRAYDQLHWTRIRPWRCARHLNAGAYIGTVAAVRRLSEVWRRPDTVSALRDMCPASGRFGMEGQCVASAMLLAGHYSMQLDYREVLFATASTAVQGGRGTARSLRNRQSSSCAWCGAVPCRCSSEFVWCTDAEQRLQRNAEHRSLCNTSTEPPLLLHFNNPAGKRLLSTHVRRKRTAHPSSHCQPTIGRMRPAAPIFAQLKDGAVRLDG